MLIQIRMSSDLVEILDKKSKKAGLDRSNFIKALVAVGDLGFVSSTEGWRRLEIKKPVEDFILPGMAGKAVEIEKVLKKVEVASKLHKLVEEKSLSSGVKMPSNFISFE